MSESSPPLNSNNNNHNNSSSSQSTSSSSSSASASIVSLVSSSSCISRSDAPIICPGHSRPVPDLAFTDNTADGYFLISSCLDNKSMLREGATGDWIGTFIGHKGAIWCSRLNTEATRAATGAADFSAKLWDALSGDELHSFTHKHIVKAVEFSKDSRYLYTGGHEKKLRIFDIEKTDAEADILEDHKSAISHVIKCPSNPFLLFSAGSEKDIRIWDTRTKKVERIIETSGDVKSVQISIDGTTLSASIGKQVFFYDAATFNTIKSYNLSLPIDCVSFDPYTKRFVTGSNSELWVRVYDYTSGDEIACNKGHHGPVRALAFSPSGANYASGSEDGTIRIWQSNWGVEEKNNNGISEH